MTSNLLARSGSIKWAQEQGISGFVVCNLPQ